MQFLARGLGFHVHYVFVGSGSGRTGRLPPPIVPDGYRVRMVDADELERHVGLAPGITPAFVDGVRRLGDACVASFRQGRLVGFSFESTCRAVVNDQLDILIPAGFRYTYKTWVDPAHRQRNLSQIQNYVRYHARRRDHAERDIWYVETHNYLSLLHSYRQPGERELRMGLIGWISLFGRHVPFRTPASRWLGVEFVRKDDRRSRLRG